jgi:hypothetical protein
MFANALLRNIAHLISFWFSAQRLLCARALVLAILILVVDERAVTAAVDAFARAPVSPRRFLTGDGKLIGSAMLATVVVWLERT